MEPEVRVTLARYCQAIRGVSGILPADLEALALQVLEARDPAVLLGFNDCAKHLVNLCKGEVPIPAIADVRPTVHGFRFRGVPVVSLEKALELPARRYVVTAERNNYLYAEAVLARHPGRRVIQYPLSADKPPYHLNAARHLPWLRFMDERAPKGMGMTEARLVFLCESLRQCLSLPGDVAEVGVFQGCSAWHLARILEQSAPDRRLLLFDLFEHLPESEPDGIMCLDEVRALVAYPRAELYSGDAGEQAGALRAARLCFAHLDIGFNVPAAVEAAFEAVVPGGVLVLDNYGEMKDHIAARYALWFRGRGHPIAAVPGSTQGWLVKRG